VLHRLQQKIKEAKKEQERLEREKRFIQAEIDRFMVKAENYKMYIRKKNGFSKNFPVRTTNYQKLYRRSS